MHLFNIQMRLPLFLIFSIGIGAQVCAKDYYLLIGGGSSPKTSQISIEENILFSLQVLQDRNIEKDSISTLFASGNHQSIPDVCYKSDIPESYKLLGAITNRNQGIDLYFRHHKIDSAEGPYDRSSIERQIKSIAKKITDQDRLIIYVTSHGGKGKPLENGHMNLWKSDKYKVQDFAKTLEAVPQTVPVFLVMVQCYSGSFANLIYKDGQVKSGLANRPICGVFATVQDRPAAGCTPDVLKSNYEEYSTYFWAAMGSKDRSGNPINAKDINQDGQISFDECHAHTVANSNTIDIPQITSDLFLRNEVKPDEPVQFRCESLCQDTLNKSKTWRAFAIASLCKAYNIDHEFPVSAAESLIKRKEEKSKELKKKMGDINRSIGSFRWKLRTAIETEYPFIMTSLHPETTRILESGELEKKLKENPETRRMITKFREMSKVNQEKTQIDKDLARLKRILELGKSEFLHQELMMRSENDEIKQRYMELIQLESSVL